MPETHTTRHTCNDGAGPAFGRKSPGCARCDELLAGAAPRVAPAWVRGVAAKRAMEQARTRAIRAHSCKASGCASMCVKFDW